MRYKVEFAKKRCGRCGGRGTYAMAVRAEGIGGATYGTCYGCSGRGWNLLPTGQRAYHEFMARRMVAAGMPAKDVCPGDRVQIDGRWRCITKVEHVSADGRVDLHYTNCSHGMPPETRLISARLLREAWPGLVEFARGLKGATVVEVPDAAPREGVLDVR